MCFLINWFASTTDAIYDFLLNSDSSNRLAENNNCAFNKHLLTSLVSVVPSSGCSSLEAGDLKDLNLILQSSPASSISLTSSYSLTQWNDPVASTLTSTFFRQLETYLLEPGEVISVSLTRPACHIGSPAQSSDQSGEVAGLANHLPSGPLSSHLFHCSMTSFPGKRISLSAAPSPCSTPNDPSTSGLVDPRFTAGMDLTKCSFPRREGCLQSGSINCEVYEGANETVYLLCPCELPVSSLQRLLLAKYQQTCLDRVTVDIFFDGQCLEPMHTLREVAYLYAVPVREHCLRLEFVFADLRLAWWGRPMPRLEPPISSMAPVSLVGPANESSSANYGAYTYVDNGEAAVTITGHCDNGGTDDDRDSNSCRKIRVRGLSEPAACRISFCAHKVVPNSLGSRKSGINQQGD
ncbi:unnamed protein product [Protopolystoma xenopodis]|uniref:Uncharacterized protein n=1 Tax=Protopolystoma xenopodis TaxID=117903 RepID=A0A3S5CN41_9PLAT|nr:unnamed protein product [Protopolystoma xenopodis]